MAKEKPPKNNLIRLIKWFFIFLLTVIHVRFIMGLAEISPSFFPSLSLVTQAKVSKKHTQSTRSTSYKSSNSSSRISYYIDVNYQLNGQSYTNNDLVSESLYDQLEEGDNLKVKVLRTLPSVGHIQQNAPFLINNFKILSLVLILFDMFIFGVGYWIKKRRQK